MTCEEYRAAFNAWLDGRRSEALAEDARRHAATCAACAGYAAAIGSIDAGLRQIPAAEMPGSLLAFPDTIVPGARAPRAPGRLAAAARFLAPALVPPLAVWAAGLFLPPAWGGALSFLLATTGLVMFGVASLRPKFSNS